MTAGAAMVTSPDGYFEGRCCTPNDTSCPESVRKGSCDRLKQKNGALRADDAIIILRLEIMQCGCFS